MDSLKNLNKDNLHHAYLIEGARDEILPELLKLIDDMGVKTVNNPDFCRISLDTFKINDARELKSMQCEKGLGDKKIFLISANNFLLEAQNTLLKIFEEPIINTHFFLVVPNKDILLKTLISRFYLVQTKSKLEKEIQMAENFITMPLKDRLDFIKDLLKEDEEGTGDMMSSRSKASAFLNALESVVHQKIMFNMYKVKNISFFDQILKVREYINQPGSSLKILLESVALVTPIF